MNQSLTTNGRRGFLRSSAAVAGLALVGGNAASLAAQAEENEIPVSPTEDLMREHGVLDRILLIYEESIRRLHAEGKELPHDALKNAVSIVRSFIQDYHEKTEEQQLFPRFEKAGKLVELVKTLDKQHDAGRHQTDIALKIVSQSDWNEDDRKKLTDSLSAFIRMYRPHKAREDTVLYPALHEIVSRNEYDALGEDFEREEQKLFGKDGFHDNVERVAAIEKQLGIYDLAQFTPQ